MSTQVQYRRGSTAENDAFTGALAEITVDTTAGSLRVHNGVNAGGSKLATEAYVTTAIGALSANSITNGTSSVAVISSGGNVNANVGGATVGTFYSGGLSVPGIINSGANGVGNIGSATGYFNTVFAKATSAQYADVAEMYTADANYTVGTVLVFGGNNEVTMSNGSHLSSIAGTVSAAPAFIMNSSLQHECKTAVALLGRVPCRVVGRGIKKGDRIVSSQIPGVATKLNPELYQPGCIIGKSLEDYDSDDIGTIEIVVGRL